MIYCVYYRRKGLWSETKEEKAYVCAASTTDAKRVLEENLDSNAYEVVWARKSDMNQVTQSDLTVNFKSPFAE